MHNDNIVRTTVDLDRDLVRRAMKAGDIPTMREVIDLALREFVEKERRVAAIRRHRGRHPDFEAPEDDPRE